MMQTPARFIFVDLDETLVHNTYLGHRLTDQKRQFMRDEDKLLTLPSLAYEDVKDYYSSRVRPGALEFLQKLRQNYPVVEMLTAATEDYAFATNEAHGLGFKPDQIHSRDSNICKGEEKYQIFPRIPVLLDNLPASQLYKKFGKLRVIGDQCGFIRIREFYGRDEQELTSTKIDAIIEQINDLDALVTY